MNSLYPDPLPSSLNVLFVCFALGCLLNLLCNFSWEILFTQLAFVSIFMVKLPEFTSLAQISVVCYKSHLLLFLDIPWLLLIAIFPTSHCEPHQSRPEVSPSKHQYCYCLCCIVVALRRSCSVYILQSYDSIEFNGDKISCELFPPGNTVDIEWSYESYRNRP